MAKDIRPPLASAYGTQMPAAVSATEKYTICQMNLVLLHCPNNQLSHAMVHSHTELVKKLSVGRSNSPSSLHRSLDTE